MYKDFAWRKVALGVRSPILGAVIAALMLPAAVQAAPEWQPIAYSGPRQIPDQRQDARRTGGSTGGSQVAAMAKPVPVPPRRPAWRLARAEPRFDLDRVRAGHAEVPRVFLASLPPDLPRTETVANRKALFVKALLPLILAANDDIAAERRRLLDIAARVGRGRELDGHDAGWLALLARAYRVDLKVPGALAELIRRVDIVPASLALAQAAAESGWGRSRFAVEGNAVFGQRVWRKGAGIVPRRRASGEIYEVKDFASLSRSIAAYMRNLNVHPAYAALRLERAGMRRDFGRLDGYLLAGGLLRYSERGVDYVRALRAVIRANRFGEFDRARLARRPLLAVAGKPPRR